MHGEGGRLREAQEHADLVAALVIWRAATLLLPLHWVPPTAQIASVGLTETAARVRDLGRRSEPTEEGSFFDAVFARAEAGAIVRLHECSKDWCRVSGGGEKGWVPKTSLWGVDAGELRD